MLTAEAIDFMQNVVFNGGPQLVSVSIKVATFSQYLDITGAGYQIEGTHDFDGTPDWTPSRESDGVVSNRANPSKGRYQVLDPAADYYDVPTYTQEFASSSEGSAIAANYANVRRLELLGSNWYATPRFFQIAVRGTRGFAILDSRDFPVFAPRSFILWDASLAAGVLLIGAAETVDIVHTITIASA